MSCEKEAHGIPKKKKKAMENFMDGSKGSKGVARQGELLVCSPAKQCEASTTGRCL